MSKNLQELLKDLPIIVIVEGLVRAGQRLAEECWVLMGKPMKADPRDPEKKKLVGAVPFLFTREEAEANRRFGFGPSLDTAAEAFERMKARYAGLVEAKVVEAKATLNFSLTLAGQVVITATMSADEIMAALARAKEMKADFDAAVAAKAGGWQAAPIEAKPVVEAKAAPEKAAPQAEGWKAAVAKAGGGSGTKIEAVKAATAEVRALAASDLSSEALRATATEKFRVAAEKVRDAGLSDGSVKQAWKQAVAEYEEAWQKAAQGVASLPTTAAAGGGK